MGGPSAEHEVSLNTGKAVVENLDKERYEVMPVIISKSNVWHFPDGSILGEKSAILKIKDSKPEVVFLALHGEYGEDGTIQELLESNSIKFTGSGFLSSALGMNKAASLELLGLHSLKVPRFIVFSKNDNWHELKSAIKEKFGFPVVIKPLNRGSSVGVTIVKDARKLEEAIQTCFVWSSIGLAQEYIKGREITVGVIGNKKEIYPLPPTEIIPKKSDFFDYKAKYTPGVSEEITPANIPKNLTQKVQDIAVKAHSILGCSGISRTDMIVNKNGDVYVLEINTLPGLTSTSLIPQQAKAAGISFRELLDKIIETA